MPDRATEGRNLETSQEEQEQIRKKLRQESEQNVRRDMNPLLDKEYINFAKLYCGLKNETLNKKITR
jgi:hypothetical protein